MKIVLPIVLPAVLLSGIALTALAGCEQSKDDKQITLVTKFLQESLPRLDKNGFELSFAIKTSDDGATEGSVATCNSSGNELPCDEFEKICGELQCGLSTNSGGGIECACQ